MAMLSILAVILTLSPVICKEIKSSAESGQRYAVLKSFIAGGTKNVRWETTPLRYTDHNGNELQKPSGKNHANATFGCVDMQGKERSNGEEYERPNGKFKYKCSNGAEEVTACTGSDRTNKAIIPVGKTLDVNGYWHKCQSFPNGSVVYTEAASCRHGEKEYHVGEEINVGFLRLQCQENGYKIIGCFYLDDNNNAVPLSSGETKVVGKVTHYCENKGDSLQYSSTASGCTKAGKNYKEGETFSQSHLNYKCTNGIVDITGCYIEENKPLNIGQDIVEQNIAHRCYRNGGKIEYSEYPCGQKGTPSCQLEPIPASPDNAPTLSRGLHAPGFNSFSISQQVGGQAADPSSIKLGLNKILMQQNTH